MIPISAAGASVAGSSIVMCSSQGAKGTSRPRPNGPINSPTRMKPMIGVMRKRAKTGITAPAAARMISASATAGEVSSVGPAMT